MQINEREARELNSGQLKIQIRYEDSFEVVVHLRDILELSFCMYRLLR